MSVNVSRPPRARVKWLDQLPKLRIGVLGDFAVDRYLIGKTSRISREAPVLILKKQEESILPGQAGNSAANLAALGVQAMAFGIVGDDADGAELAKALAAGGVRTDGLVAARGARTLVKTRVLAGGHHTNLQQVIRLDDDEGLNPSAAARRELSRALAAALPELDALLVSDYGYGTVDARLWKKIVPPRASGGRGRVKNRIPIVLDSRHGLGKLRGADVITPNETEVFAHLGISRFAGADPVKAGRAMMKLSGCGGLVMTQGNEGMLIFSGRTAPTRLAIFGSDQVTDVTGAGDTVSAVIAALRAGGADLVEAAVVANVAAGLTVMQRGAATVGRDALRGALKQWNARRA